MSFYDIYSGFKDIDLSAYFKGLTDETIKRALSAEKTDIYQFLSLLSPKAENHMEEMAGKAHRVTLQYFGRTIQLYTPMYLSDYCVNECIYCGFNVKNDKGRKKLSLEEVETEGKYIASTGLKHILILTGESRSESPVSYIKDCASILKKYFDSISIEIYPLIADEYKELITAGVDGLTIYQEVYDEEIYDSVHLKGPKRDYKFRLNAPERAAQKGIRTINIGALLGLGEWRREGFSLGAHAQYLQNQFGDIEISVSIPRFRPYNGEYKPEYSVTDRNVVQIILALRIFLPRVGITLSTRESPAFRENLIPLGVTRMSAGSTTRVGGHTLIDNDQAIASQFEIHDKRDVSEIRKIIHEKGYQPVLKDWMDISYINEPV